MRRMAATDFDLDAYLHRIAYTGPREPTLAVLTALCAAHPAAIPFESIDPLLGRPPSLAIADIQGKLVDRRRGGYCFEQNALLRRALLALGFDVTSLAARVVWMMPPDAPVRPRTHMLLLVTVPGDATRPRLVDAGFGGHLINVPLRLQAGLLQASPASQLRFTEAGDVFTLESQLPEGWRPLYRFTLETMLPTDYEPLNWFTATHPTSIFRHNLRMERLTPGTRASLLNDRLTLRTPGQPASMRQLATAGEFAQVLEEVFDVQPPLPAAELFERLPKGLDGPLIPSLG